MAAGLSPAILRADRADKLKLAVIGVGGRSRSLIKEAMQHGAGIAAVCDVDEAQIAGALKQIGETAPQVKTYRDYRKLLEAQKNFDGVMIATPDHWHAPLCKAFLKAGQNVYCEKPLTRTIAEARELRELARSSKCVTQMGNQGSGTASLRRAAEIIRAGLIGQVHNIYGWVGKSGWPRGIDRPEGSDPLPENFNWDLWLGPAPVRPYKAQLYHPSVWRGWYDFGTGSLGDFGCHAFNLPMRALDLSYPNRVEIDGSTGLGHESYAATTRIKLQFPARSDAKTGKKLDPLTIHWFDGGEMPSDQILKDVLAVYKKQDVVRNGLFIVGERGFIYSNIWGGSAVLKLEGDARPRGVLDHEQAKPLPQLLPAPINHVEEWLKTCRREAGLKTLSDFDTGGLLTEISLAGVVALRLQKSIDWDGAAMAVKGSPEASCFVKPDYRRGFLL